MFAKSGLRLLMYHKVGPTPDALTVTEAQLRSQLEWVRESGYRFVSASQVTEWIAAGRRPEPRSLLVTFDDGYVSQLERAVPILRELGIPAIFFVTVSKIGGHSDWDGNGEPLLNPAGLRELTKQGFELGLHSFAHGRYDVLPVEAVRHDLQSCRERLAELELPYLPALAYPYGRFPRSHSNWTLFREMLKAEGIQWAVRIGNRVNGDLSDPYRVNRLDVQGTFSPRFFGRRVQRGKGLLDWLGAL